MIWIYCPICSGKTRVQVSETTTMTDYPLFCPKCKHTSFVNYKNGVLVPLQVPVAQSQSRKPLN